MKTLNFLILFSFISLISALHFDISQEPIKCYYEELFRHSVAVIKYKLWTSPASTQKCKNKNLLSVKLNE